MTQINHPDMVHTLAKDGNHIISQLTPLSAHILHMAVGIAGEVAELSEAVFYGPPISEEPKYVIEELGDIEFYHTGLCQALDFEPLQTEGATIPLFEHHEILTHLTIKAGEILDYAKKIAIYANDSEEVRDNLIESVKQFRLLLNVGYIAAELTREQAIQANIDKLAVRYEGFVYSNEAAKERKDKQA